MASYESVKGDDGLTDDERRLKKFGLEVKSSPGSSTEPSSAQTQTSPKKSGAGYRPTVRTTTPS